MKQATYRLALQEGLWRQETRLEAGDCGMEAGDCRTVIEAGDSSIEPGHSLGDAASTR